jgi:hypothetical protein
VQKHHWLGLRRREIVEITAGRGMRVPDRTARRPIPAPYSRDIQARPAPAQTLPAVLPAAGGAALLQTPVAQAVAMAAVAQEMNALKTMVKDLVSQTRSRGAPNIPEDLFNHYLHLIENQVAEDLATDIIKTLQTQLRPEHWSTRISSARRSPINWKS